MSVHLTALVNFLYLITLANSKAFHLNLYFHLIILPIHDFVAMLLVHDLKIYCYCVAPENYYSMYLPPLTLSPDRYRRPKGLHLQLFITYFPYHYSEHFLRRY